MKNFFLDLSFSRSLFLWNILNYTHTHTFLKEWEMFVIKQSYGTLGYAREFFFVYGFVCVCVYVRVDV
jgi:hypothetical protein